MKKFIISFILILAVMTPGYSQEIILQENFGANTWDGNPADYPEYTSTASFSGDDSHLFQTAGSAGYSGASGGAAVLMGSWSDSPENTEFVMQFNTEGYTSVRLSFGFKHNSGGWGTCQLTNNFTKIEYSTDSSTWNVLDKAALLEGSSWPCAEESIWSYVELAEVLPSVPDLYIRFTHTDPTIHPYYLDDITLTAFPPDNIPPTAPSNLQAADIGFNSFTLTWNAAKDESGISHYKICKDGFFLMATTDTVAEIKYQQAGSTADFAVRAYDVAQNPSPESEILYVTLRSKPVDYKYPWEKAQAKVLPSGNIEWQPEDFSYQEGSSVRYIDFENGDDANDGMTQSTPWQHHPWDANATAEAAACRGIHTYVFKRGVVYRGVLNAEDSGTPLEPIRLTSNPAWGTGEAFFFGSTRISGGWTLADAVTAPDIPEPGKVWYIDMPLSQPKTLVEIDGEGYKQVRVARSPNYEVTTGDPLETWWTMTGKSEGDGGLWLTDNNNLTGDDPDFYKNATIFSQEDAIVMCTVWKQDVQEWDPENNRIKVANTNFGGIGSHYYIENTPFLLDTTGEFYYDPGLQRLFVRLEGDKDPNTATLEVASETQLINIDNKHDIEISGLTFGMTTAHSVRYGQEDARTTIKMTGICSNITIKNNRFHYVNGGVSLTNAGSAAFNSHSITVSDNDFQNVGDLSIVFSTSNAYIDDINILRNNIYNAGYRNQGRWYGSIPAIYGQLNYGEVAGNIIERSWGNGIDMFWGKGGGSSACVPFIRGLVHHNKASNTLIGTNDYGGIESWQGGPAFIYNNFSHNASGYKHYNNSSIGYAYYFDGAFKHIVFNNIASGISHDRNSAGIMQVLGFYNMYVHNTGYNTRRFLNAWKGTLALKGYNTYLSNLAEDVATFFRHEIDPEFIPFEAYGYNVSSGNPFNGSLESLSNDLNLEGFRTKLEGYDARLAQTGWNAPDEVLPAAGSHDFRPATNSSAVGRGVKFFTAFPLARVVGEWNFYRNPADSGLIMADNFYMTEDFNDRTTYDLVPKNHLTAHNVSRQNFIQGNLEDWTEGALLFDGNSVYCSLGHATAGAVKSNNIDMTVNDFIIEVYLKTAQDHTGSAIISKVGTTGGYELGIDGSGHIKMRLFTGAGEAVGKTSATAVNDTLWHHVLVEVNRHAEISIYIDGELSDGNRTGNMPSTDVSLSNEQDLLVGKDAGDNYFHGAIDFLRISKGSLYDAKTTIDELYKWQTDGPFGYDMRGMAPEGKRDAGALETTGTCQLSISEVALEFDAAASVQKITVNTTDDYFIRDVSGDFFTTSIDADTIAIDVQENFLPEERKGSFTVFSCNESVTVKLTQNDAPCSFEIYVDTLKLDYKAQSAVLHFNSNVVPEFSAGMNFAEIDQAVAMDSAVIMVTENSGEVRMADIQINACDEIYTVVLMQEGTVGLRELNYRRLEIFPNPVSEGRFNLLLPENPGDYEYLITDLSGKMIQNGKLQGNRVVIEFDVDPGTYLIKVSGGIEVYEGMIMVL